MEQAAAAAMSVEDRVERGWVGRAGLIRMTPEWRQALGPRQGVRRNRRVPVIAVLEMVQELADDVRLGDERNDAHVAAAVFANQWVGFEYTADKVGPSSPKGFALGGVELVVVHVGWFLLVVFSCSPSVVAVVQDGMLVRLGNVDEHAGDR